MEEPRPNSATESDAAAAPAPAPAALGPVCRHLRHKGMYVYTSNPDEADEDEASGAFWCLKTMKDYGPDDDQVYRAACRDPQRTCYEPL